MTRRGRLSFFLVLITVMATTGCSHEPARSVSSGAGQFSVAATAVPPLREAQLFSHTYRLAPSGPLAHPQIVRLPLTRRVPPGWIIVVATAETSRGPWSYLPARTSADRRTAVFTVTHHSVFTVIGEDLSSLLHFFKIEFLDGLTSGTTATAAPPSCEDQQAARSGYILKSSSGRTVYWCFGLASSGDRILRIVNDRPYPLEIQHPGLAVAEKPAIDYSSLSSLAHVLPGGLSILAPDAQIGYRVGLAPGQASSAETALDGFGQSLFALQTGINALLAILTRFGAGGASKGITVMNDALGSEACANAMLAGNPGSILASCLSPKDMIEYFGTAGVLLAPLAAVGGFADFFVSEFHALHDVWTNKDKYLILVRAAATAKPTQKVDISAVSSNGQLAAGLHISQRAVANGGCEGDSEAIGTAYRCFAGNHIYDPCWEGLSNSQVWCLPDPWSLDVTQLEVPGTLVALTGLPDSRPWGLQLADGADCLVEQGAHDEFQGRPIDYSCGPHEVILRGLDTSETQWRAQTALLNDGRYTIGPLEGVTIAWIGKADFTGPAGP